MQRCRGPKGVRTIYSGASCHKFPIAGSPWFVGRANHLSGRADSSRGSAFAFLSSLVGRGRVVSRRFDGEVHGLLVLVEGRLALVAGFEKWARKHAVVIAIVAGR